MAARELYHIGVDIIVYDSSDDARTESVVRNFQIDGLSNVIYDRWSGKWDGFSLDNKVIDAYKKYSRKYEYLWAHRDGLIVVPKYVNDIIKLLSNNLDMLIVNTSCRDVKNIGQKIYNKPAFLFKDQCMQMTVLGATIVRTDIIMDIINKIPLEKDVNYGMWQPIAFFQYFSNKSISAKSFVDDVWFGNPSAAKSSFGGKNTMLQWCDMWYDMITKLPSCYDKYKNDVLKVEMSDFHPYRVINLISLRANNGIDYSTVKKMARKIKYVSDTKLKMFYFVSLLPKSCAKFIYNNRDGNIGKILIALYYVIFGIVPGEKEILQ